MLQSRKGEGNTVPIVIGSSGEENKQHKDSLFHPTTTTTKKDKSNRKKRAQTRLILPQFAPTNSTPFSTVMILMGHRGITYYSELLGNTSVQRSTEHTC